MNLKYVHPWNVSTREAIEIQKDLRHQLVFKALPNKIKRVAGTDVSSSKRSNFIWAGAVVLEYPSLKTVEERWVEGTPLFPYIPGLLSFREIPLILEAIGMLEHRPDVFFCDGQGIAHPRGLGIASHLGVLIDRPTIGCAKKRLVGDFSEVGPARGDYSMLTYKGETVGTVLRTRTGVKPIFVSPGHRATIKDALHMVLNCGGRYRIPEPIRQAHLLVNRVRKKAKK